MDEAGHSGDSGASRSDSGGDSRDRALTNGWTTSDSPWSNAGAALDPEDDDVAPWRRPAEVRPFAGRSFGADHPSGEFAAPRRTDDVLRGYADPAQSRPAQPRPAQPQPVEYPLPADHLQTADHLQPVEYPPPAESPEERPHRPSRFSDLLSRFPTGGGRGSASALPTSGGGRPTPAGGEGSASGYGAGQPAFGPADIPTSGFRPLNAPTSGFRPNEMPPGPAPGAGVDRRLGDMRNVDAPPPGVGVDRRLGDMRNVDAPPPSSAPPYPYEGDLDDARRETPRPVGQQRTAVPLTRSFRPGGAADVGQRDRPDAPSVRRPEWNAPESARHAREPNAPGDGMPRVGSPPAPSHAEPAGPAGSEAVQPRPSYDPSSFPRRLPYEGPYAGDPTDRAADEAGTGLPQRVPAEPDVPTIPEPPPVEPTAETPALARIREHLRRDDVVPADERQEGFDVNAIVEAVKEVDGVRDARLHATPQGAHSLRLDLAEGADPAEVSRQVARLLQDRMGLDAAMKGATGMPPMSAPPALSPSGVPAGPPAPSEPLEAVPAAVAGVATVPPPASPRVPSQPIPAGRAPVSGGPGGPAQTQVIPTQQPPLPPRPRPGRGTSPVPASSPVSAPIPGKPPYVPGPSTTTETVPLGGELGGPRPLRVGDNPGPRAVIENVQVTTSGVKAEVEVKLSAGHRVATGTATGPSLDGYLLRLCAMAAAEAIDGMLATSEHAEGPARCHIHHAAVVPFGSVQVAVVVVLLSCGSWVDQLAGSAVVTGDDGRAMVQATLAAVNRRLEALLS